MEILEGVGAIDAGGVIYDSFIRWYGKYDYILNLSALKHVMKRKGSIYHLCEW